MSFDEKIKEMEIVKNNIHKEVIKITKFARKNIDPKEVNFLGMIDELVKDIDDSLDNVIEKTLFIAKKYDDTPHQGIIV